MITWECKGRGRRKHDESKKTKRKLVQGSELVKELEKIIRQKVSKNYILLLF